MKVISISNLYKKLCLILFLCLTIVPVMNLNKAFASENVQDVAYGTVWMENGLHAPPGLEVYCGAWTRPEPPGEHYYYRQYVTLGTSVTDENGNYAIPYTPGDLGFGMFCGYYDGINFLLDKAGAGTVYGTVVSYYGNVIAGAAVELNNGLVTKTNNMGVFGFYSQSSDARVKAISADGFPTNPVNENNTSVSAWDGGLYIIMHASPIVEVTTDREPDLNGWYNHDINVNFLAYDDTGTEIRDYDRQKLVSTEGMNQPITLSVTDKFGLTGQGSISINLDKTPPVTTPSITESAQVNNWYSSDILVTLNIKDNLSGVSKTEYRINGRTWTNYTEPFNVTTEGTNTIEYQSMDHAGNVEVTKSMTVVIDKTSPTTSATLSPSAPNAANGWYTTDVAVTLSAQDHISGVAKTEYRINGGNWTPYTSAFTISAEGTNSIEYRSIDNVGNVEAVSATTIKIDKSTPTLAVRLDVTSIKVPNHKLVPIHATLNYSDSISGIASVVLTSITSNEPDNGMGDGEQSNDNQDAVFGTQDESFMVRAERSGTNQGRVYTITYTVMDNAGNKTTSTSTVTVPHNESSK